MKKICKILCTLFVFAAMCGAFTILASAETDSPSIELSSAKGGVGQTVSVTATVKNNPGIVSLYLSLEYDMTRVQLVSVEDCGLFDGAVFGESVEDYPQALTWDESTTNKDNFSNGKLVTLTFKILENAPLGIAEIKLKNSGGIINNNLESVDFELKSGTVEVIEYIPTSSIDTASVVLSEGIGVNYYANIDPMHIGAEMRFTMNGKVTRVSGTATENKNIYVYKFENIAPQCMGDNIKAELLFDGEVVAVRESFSIVNYCDNLFEQIKNKSIEGYTDDMYSALSLLLRDLLNYGAASQNFTDYKVNELVNERVEGGREYEELTSDCEKYIEESALDGVYLTDGGVRFSNVNYLYFKFVAKDVNEENFAVKITDYNTEESVMYYLSDCEVVSAEDSVYLLYSDAILPTMFDNWYSIELCTLNSRGRWVSQQFLEYSVSSYVYYMQNQVDGAGELTDMAVLARALYNYGLSASEFVAIGG